MLIAGAENGSKNFGPQRVETVGPTVAAIDPSQTMKIANVAL
jgi:hypothetical protein